ncbi:tetratricopeptide repeat protein [Flavobacterium sp. ov086]|uniref:tetratricopeptide repeat protein n=1 Tax=Flavobacterium sp. ov086 TaxID=1761785 RepID=UPI000B6CC6F9|nr:tetratricopeptide repeat protein [Flavobacterium sp. ov086]SNR86783.1 Tetratricopeptide repeat-containing protein [Flavobacterium sp. ov086]
MLKIIIFLVLFLCSNFNYAQNQLQDSIVQKYVINCAKKYNYNYQMSEWQNCLNNGLKSDSTVAYLWQQKAMPYFKARKYDVGMQYLNKAVQYDALEWQPYRAFIKCIFAKTYRESIVDFEDCIKKFGNGYSMEHRYSFYIGLCYLQLNEYEKAEKIFKEYNDDLFKNRQGLEHPTALFYYGIAKYELKKWDEAIVLFDKALAIYPNFSDVIYYKAICLARLGSKEEDIKALLTSAREDAKLGYTINEDNTIYEIYPYQIRWGF